MHSALERIVSDWSSCRGSAAVDLPLWTKWAVGVAWQSQFGSISTHAVGDHFSPLFAWVEQGKGAGVFTVGIQTVLPKAACFC